jgi:hypothetical protein
VRPAIAERILKFPTDVRKSLAEVPGPGWYVWGDGGGGEPLPAAPPPEWRNPNRAWWPANPADALRAVLGYDTLQAYERVTHWILTRGCDDHDAAVAIIEWSLS